MTEPQSFLSKEIEDWFEANHKNALPQRVWTMLRKHGRTPGKNCRTCRHLERQHYHRKNFYKCTKFRITRGEQTDWRLKWPACGLFEEITEKRPTIQEE